MDRFKFRAWHKTIGIMITQDNVDEMIVKYDCDDRDEEGLFTISEIYPASEIHGIFDYFKDVAQSEPIEIMQCTGLKDENDNLIYEGDILTPGIGCDDFGSEATIVVWVDDGWYLQEIHGDWLHNFEWIEDLVIIGNIYENADLLEHS